MMSILKYIIKWLNDVKRRPKPSLIQICIAVFLFFLALFATSMFEPPIDDIVDNILYEKSEEPEKSEITATINQVVRLQNNHFINISKLQPGNYVYRVENFVAIKYNPDELPTVNLNFDGELVFDEFLIGWITPYNYIGYNRTITQQNCLIYFFTSFFETGQSQQATLSFDTKAPSYDNFSEYYFLIENSGNKTIEDYKTNICLEEGLIVQVESDYSDNVIRKMGHNCIEIEIEHFFSGDKIDGRFYVTEAYIDSNFTVSINSYDENGEFSNQILSKNIIFLFPNCTYELKGMEPIELLYLNNEY